jgi:hypothetical protein
MVIFGNMNELRKINNFLKEKNEHDLNGKEISFEQYKLDFED